MSQPIRGQGGHIVFWISPKNTNLVEDVENLLSVKFCWIPFSGFVGEVENVSANQRTGWLSCFSDQPEKRKPDRGCWDLASCQVLLNSIQQFQREKLKMSQQIIKWRLFCFSDPPEKHKLIRRALRSCFLSRFVEFLSAVSDEKSKMSQPIRGQGGHFVFSRLAWKTQMW